MAHLEELLKISPQVLNLLFEQICKNSNTVCWIRTPDWQRQIYITTSFEKILGWETNAIYENPNMWQQILCKDERDKTVNKLRNLNSKKFGPDILFYKLIDSSGETRYICDKHFCLLNKKDELIAFSGVAEILSADMWYDKQTSYFRNVDEITEVGESFFSRIQRDLRLENKTISRNALENKKNKKYIYQFFIDEKEVTLPKKEAEALYYLVQGKTSKQIARDMNISYRTVEIHLDKVRARTKSRSRLALLGKLDHDLISTWEFNNDA